MDTVLSSTDMMWALPSCSNMKNQQAAKRFIQCAGSKPRSIDEDSTRNTVHRSFHQEARPPLAFQRKTAK